MNKVEKIVSLRLSPEQFIELKRRADEQDLSVPNYLRSLLGFEVEHQGARNDLPPREPAPPRPTRGRGRPRKEASE